MTEIMSLRLDKEDKKRFLQLAENQTQSSLFSEMITAYCKYNLMTLRAQADCFLLENNELNDAMGNKMIENELNKIDKKIKLFCDVISYEAWETKKPM